MSFYTHLVSSSIIPLYIGLLFYFVSCLLLCVVSHDKLSSITFQ